MSESAPSSFNASILASEASNNPITLVVSYLTVLWSGFHSVFNLIAPLFRPFLLLSPLPILLYLFAPAIVFVEILVTLFIGSPYRAVAYLLDALFPLYIFCGVACITGCILGIAARILCRFIVNFVQDEDDAGEDDEEKVEKVDVKGKGRKVEDDGRVKFEL